MTEPDASAFRLIQRAESCLHEAMERWQPLHDPEPERDDQNFQLDGKQYNYRAAETSQILQDLAGGILTRYPLESIAPTATDDDVMTQSDDGDVKMTFDVFLSHNSKDKPAIRQLGEALRGRGMSVWLDEGELVPGRPWLEALEEIIKTTKSAVVSVGADGLGPWEDPEMRACLSEFVDRKLPVIPVLLPGAPTQPDLPLFLRAFTWVDLRGGIDDAGLDRLEWGITGKKPTVAVAPAASTTPPPAAPVTRQAPGGPLATWKEKLQFLQTEEAITADPAQKFALKKQIEEAEQKIAELES